MEVNEKAFARQKFRSSRGRGRGSRGGGAHRGAQYNGPSRPAPRDLDSNAFRYEEEAEEEGVVVPKSQGADLETLIEDADVQFNQAFYRFRAQLHHITEEVPPLGATQPDQLLAIDLDALTAGLSALPLHALLGLEPEFLEGVELSGLTVSASGGTAAGQRQPGESGPATKVTWVGAAAAGGAPQQPPQPPAAGQSPHPMASTPVATGAMRVHDYTGAASTMVAPTVVVEAGAAVVTAPPPAVGPAPVGGPPAASSAGSAGAVASTLDRDDDDELEALLTGRAAPPGPVHAGSRLQSGAVETRPTGAVLPPALAAAMAAVRVPAQPAGPLPGPQTRSHMATTIITAPTAAQPGQMSGGIAGPGPTPTPLVPGGSFTVRLGPAGIPGVAGAAVAPATHGSMAGLAKPGATLPSAGSSTAGLPSTRLAAGPLAPAATVPRPGGGSGAAAPPLLVQRQSLVPAAAGPGAGGSGSGAAVMDDELRLLLGLPVAAATDPPKPAVTLGISAGAPAKAVSVRPGLQPAAEPLPTAAAGRAVLPSWAPRHQQQAKNLDDWLDSM